MVTFKLEEEVNFKSGQYIFVTLPKLLYPDERGAKRQFSINNAPSLKNQIIISTRLSESGFKKTLNELPLKSVVELGPIAGAFVLPDNTSRPLVLIAGGIGITPYMSMLRHIQKNNLSYNITLVYSNRNQASTAFLDELQLMATQLSNFKLVLTMTEDLSWNGEKRIVDTQFIKDYFPLGNEPTSLGDEPTSLGDEPTSLGDEPTSDVNAQFYMVVGPPKMVEAVKKSLLDAGVIEDNIKIENFTGY